jgi:hypothetical protein
LLVLFVVSVMIVPAETGFDAVAVHFDPPADNVWQDMTVEPTVHVLELVDGCTVATTQVVNEPAYDQMVIEGVQAAGAITVGSALRLAC